MLVTRTGDGKDGLLEVIVNAIETETASVNESVSANGTAGSGNEKDRENENENETDTLGKSEGRLGGGIAMVPKEMNGDGPTDHAIGVAAMNRHQPRQG
jgi:hypothetical protein